MTTITINNKKNFSLSTLEKLLNSLDIDVLKIENSEIDEIPNSHLESIQRGLKDLENGRVVSRKTVSEEARKLCLK